ncbi:hypothetical protein GXW71_06515 [Roseomonas hellenica]|uniref:Condensation domain-containing protein n=1 Tax=Plastoroseomonas hellenica TaxID=2687306 RepID=A0ABS5EUM4_9PROT|nr:condensation domain-containing protein [Plastoroseomonas hellenica]MBR0664006.1 hypothetical protein [Plastoroseomonas hellenica]
MNANQRRYTRLFREHALSRINNMSLAFLVQARYRRSAVRESIRRLTDRHELLRAQISSCGDDMFTLLDQNEDALEIRFVEGFSPAGLEAAAAMITTQTHLSEESRPGRNLIRFFVLEGGETEWVLIVCASHIIMDGVSVRIVLKEFCLIYESIVNKTQLYLQDTRASHSDMVAQERHQITNAERPMETLAQSLSPIISSRTNIKDIGFSPTARARCPLDDTLWRQLSQISKRIGVRSSVPYLAAFLQSEWDMGRKDVLVKTVRAERGRLSDSGLVDNFIDLSILDFRAINNVAFEAYLLDVNKVVNAAGESKAMYWPLCERHFPCYYTHPYGIIDCEFSMLIAEGNKWVDSNAISLTRIDGAVQNTSTWAQYSRCLQVRPTRDGEGSLFLLYNTCVIEPAEAEAQIAAILKVLEDLAAAAAFTPD